MNEPNERPKYPTETKPATEFPKPMFRPEPTKPLKFPDGDDNTIKPLPTKVPSGDKIMFAYNPELLCDNPFFSCQHARKNHKDMKEKCSLCNCTCFKRPPTWNAINRVGS